MEAMGPKRKSLTFYQRLGTEMTQPLDAEAIMGPDGLGSGHPLSGSRRFENLLGLDVWRAAICPALKVST